MKEKIRIADKISSGDEDEDIAQNILDAYHVP